MERVVAVARAAVAPLVAVVLLALPMRRVDRARFTWAGGTGSDRKGGVMGLLPFMPSSWPSCTCDRMATERVSMPCSRYPNNSGPINVWKPRYAPQWELAVSLKTRLPAERRKAGLNSPRTLNSQCTTTFMEKGNNTAKNVTCDAIGEEREETEYVPAFAAYGGWLGVLEPGTGGKNSPVGWTAAWGWSAAAAPVLFPLMID